MSTQGGFFDKVKDFIQGNPDKADQGLDKVGEIINERTGGKYADEVEQGSAKVREQLGIPDDQATIPVPGDPPPSPGTAPDPTTIPTPTEPGPSPTEPQTSPPVPSPDPVPTSPPETVPEAAPETSEARRP